MYRQYNYYLPRNVFISQKPCTVFDQCTQQIAAKSPIAKSARVSRSTAAASVVGIGIGIGNLFTRKMAARMSTSSSSSWPNNQEDYELRDVIGMCSSKYIVIVLFLSNSTLRYLFNDIGTQRYIYVSGVQCQPVKFLISNP